MKLAILVIALICIALASCSGHTPPTNADLAKWARGVSNACTAWKADYIGMKEDENGENLYVICSWKKVAE